MLQQRYFDTRRLNSRRSSPQSSCLSLPVDEFVITAAAAGRQLGPWKGERTASASEEGAGNSRGCYRPLDGHGPRKRAGRCAVACDAEHVGAAGRSSGGDHCNQSGGTHPAPKRFEPLRRHLECDGRRRLSRARGRDRGRYRETQRQAGDRRRDLRGRQRNRTGLRSARLCAGSRRGAAAAAQEWGTASPRGGRRVCRERRRERRSRKAARARSGSSGFADRQAPRNACRDRAQADPGVGHSGACLEFDDRPRDRARWNAPCVGGDLEPDRGDFRLRQPAPALARKLGAERSARGEQPARLWGAALWRRVHRVQSR